MSRCSFCQGQDQSWTRAWRRRGMILYSSGTWSPRNDAAPATRKDTKWRPSWPQTSVSQEAGGGGENGSGSIRPASYLHLQLRAPSPRVISTKITAATLKYKGVGGWGGGFSCLFGDTLTNRGLGAKMKWSHTSGTSCAVLPNIPFISAENVASHRVHVARRAEVTFTCRRRWGEMRDTHPFLPRAAEHTSVHLSPLAVNRRRGTCGRLRCHEAFLHLRALHLHFVLGEPRDKKGRMKDGEEIGNEKRLNEFTTDEGGMFGGGDRQIGMWEWKISRNV